jgi:predicted dehydrogenase
METIRWGILATGSIASSFAQAVTQTNGGRVVAVGSRADATARRFAERHGIPRWYGSYDGLIEDPAVDVVYVATTNDLHRANTLEALAAGKHVLCEKPLALNSTQARDMVTAAGDAGRFLMEAMWMRFQPYFFTLEELIAANRLGPVRWIQADFGFPAQSGPGGRLFNLGLGGGSLLDLGVYPLTFSYSLLGEPDEIDAVATLHESGVDEQVGILLRHSGGGVSALSCSLVADTSTEATVAGPDGRIRVHAPFHHSPMLTLQQAGATVEVFDTSYEGNGLRFEAEEVHRCLQDGLLESPRVPHRDTLAVMGLMDEVRRQVGVVYPGE